MEFLKKAAANQWVRWVAPLAVLVVLAVIFRDQFPFFGEGVRRLSDAHVPGIILAVTAAFASLFAMAEVMRLLMRAGGTAVRLREATAVTMASNSWSTTLPGGPAFSAFFTYQVQRGWGASPVLCGWFFVLSSAISTMWLVLIGACGVFFLGAKISIWSLVGSLIAMVALSWAVYWAANNPRHLEHWARSWMPPLNRLLRREETAGIESVVKHIHQLDTVHLNKRSFAAAAFWSLANRLLDAVVLWASIWAITDAAPWLEKTPDHTTIMGVLLAYTTAKIAGSAQVTPGGLGTVEATILATLVASGMTAVDATGAALIYRLISFALVTVIGWIIYFAHYARRGLPTSE